MAVPNEVTVGRLSLREVRRAGKLPSGFDTDTVFRLERDSTGDEQTWRLCPEKLPAPYTKVYDDGIVDDWLYSYLDGRPASTFRFVAARAGGKVTGLLTWQQVDWNDTLELVDIRVRDGERRRGVGSALVLWLQRSARSTGCRGISLETQINNYPAICFYRRHGFYITGFNEVLYRNDDLSRQDVALFMFWPAT
jgi:ribosomal protein S18 acetylase RimI-like enzyme